MEKRSLLMPAVGVVALILLVAVSASAGNPESLEPTYPAARLTLDGCSSDPLPRMALVNEGEALAAGLQYLVKGPTAVVVDTFPDAIWQEAFAGSSQSAALVSPDQDTIWPPEGHN